MSKNQKEALTEGQEGGCCTTKINPRVLAAHVEEASRERKYNLKKGVGMRTRRFMLDVGIMSLIVACVVAILWLLPSTSLGAGLYDDNGEVVQQIQQLRQEQEDSNWYHMMDRAEERRREYNDDVDDAIDSIRRMRQENQRRYDSGNLWGN